VVPPANDNPSVLVVDDDDALRQRLVLAFRVRGFDADGAATAEQARTLTAQESPEYAVIDLRIGEHSGLEVARALLARDPTTRVVILTGYGSIATAIEAVRLGAVHYLTKPTDFGTIVEALEHGFTGVQADAASTPSLARTEWEHINRVLVDSDGNVSEAARRLNMHRRSLQRKLAKYPPRR
jgi:two-component system response regulator RegA